LLEEKEPLKGEANYYYDVDNCGIGYHGDAERRKVVAFRMGETMPIHFQWYQKSLPVGENVKIMLEDGDMYIMSDKAVGTDWMKKKEGTLRHAAGCDKYTIIKEKKEKVVKEKKEKVVKEKKEKVVKEKKEKVVKEKKEKVVKEKKEKVVKEKKEKVVKEKKEKVVKEKKEKVVKEKKEKVVDEKKEKEKVVKVVDEKKE